MKQPDRLSTKDYWDWSHQEEALSAQTMEGPRRTGSRLKRLLGKKALEYMAPYPDHLLWSCILARHLPKVADAKALEVGSAPGQNLVRAKEHFGVVPYGVEYSKEGVDVNRKMFAQNGISPDNVIHADFLSEEFQCQYKDHFGVVISMGFVEHFADPANVVQKHINVLAEGGHLVVTIPNLRGINGLLSRFFHSEILQMHNTDIMQRRRFSRLFPENQLQTLLCDYFGTFSFGLFQTKAHSPLESVLGLCYKLQMGLNLAFRLAFRDKGAETSYFSPNLIYIGTKKAGVTPTLSEA